MSLLIETVAKEIITKQGLTSFNSGDIDILHDIYDECINRGMKPISILYNGKPHPKDIMLRIRNGMRSKLLFDIKVVPESILRKMSIYTLKER